MAVAENTAFVAESFPDAIAKDDSGILYRMVVIDFYITFHRHLQINERVAGEEGEHVIKERNASVDLPVPLTIEIQREVDVSLGSGPPSLGNSFAHSSWSAKRQGVCQPACLFPKKIPKGGSDLVGVFFLQVNEKTNDARESQKGDNHGKD